MRRKGLFKRIVAFALAGVLMFNVAPMGVVAEENAPQVGTEVKTTDANYIPDDVEGCAWERTEVRCDVLVEHTHGDSCYYQSCDHKDGHLSSCYSTATSYEKCPGNHEHSGEVTVADVVSISLSGISWKEDHPAYNAVKKAYDELGKYEKYKVLEMKFCYTVNSSATPNLCTHTCSEIGGGCYTKICPLSEHTHNSDSENPCNYYLWTLYADENNNGKPDKGDPKYTIQYVNEGKVLQSNEVLEGNPYPTYSGETPTKEADAQYTYTFSGWDIAPSETVTADVTHTAQYDKTVNKYTVTWLYEDGTELDKTEVEYGKKPEYPNETPTKDKTEEKVYTFAGWKLESTGEVGIVDVTGNATYTATFSDKNIFTVVYKVGNDTETKYVVDGEKAENYQPTRQYYTLNGWYTDTNCETKFDFTTPITSATVLFAEWVPVNDVNNDGVADEEQACSITVTGNVTSEVSGNKLPGQTITITATPAAGKYITGAIKVNGVVYETEVTFADTKATFSYTLPAGEAADYTFEVETADAGISLYSEYVNWNELMTAAEAEASVFSNINWGTMPEAVADNTKVEYMECDAFVYKSWKTIGTDDITTAFGVKVGHAFGEKETETVRFTFDGNEQVPAFKAEFTVSLKDNRLPSQIVVNDEVTFIYSPSVTEEEMAAAIFEEAFISATSEDGTVELATVYGENVFVKDAKVDAGTHTVVIDFYGTSEYAASSAEVTVVVEKADSYVNVSDANVKYGTEVNASALIDTGAAKRVELAVGLSLGENVSEDLGSVVYLNLPMLVDTDNLPEIIRPTVDSILSELTSGREITISELGKYLSDITGAIEGMGSLGESLGLNIDSTAINALTSILENLENIEGVGDIKLVVSMGQTLTLKDSGAYIVGAVVTDTNYNPSFGANYVVITPDGYKAVLDWNVKDDNGLVTREAILNGTYDFGASVVEVYEGNIEEAQAHVTTFFMGVDANGEATVTYDPKELQVGVYTQIALIKDVGNVMYYAEPIQRVFAVVPQLAEVTVDNAEVTYDGNAHAVDVTVKLADGTEYDPACLQVTYVGVDVNGEVYKSTQAPTNTGAYTVLATYLAKIDGVYEHAGFDAGVLVIAPADAKLEVEDKAYAIYDGNEHWPKITNTNNLELIKIVADDKGNVNVVLPEAYGVKPTELNAKDAVDELVKVLKDIYAGNGNLAVMAADDTTTDVIVNDVVSKLEAIGVDVYEMLEKAMDVDSILTAVEKRAEEAVKALKAADWSAVKKEVETTLNGIEVKNLSINGAGPIEDGVYTVSVIGYGKNYKLTAARGSIEIHEHDWADADCTTPKTCKECKVTEGEALGHTWGDWYVTKKPTKHTEGEERRDCANCDVYQLRTLGKLPSGGGSNHDKNDSDTELEGVYYPTSEPVTVTPPTGDSANILGYTCAVLAAGAALLFVFLKKKRA